MVGLVWRLRFGFWQGFGQVRFLSPSFLAQQLLYLVFLMPAVLWMCGVSCTLLVDLSRGSGQTDLFLPVSTWWASRCLGSLWCRHAISFPVPSLTIVGLFCPQMSLVSWCMVWLCGSLTFLSFQRPSMLPKFHPSGLPGNWGRQVLPPWRNGGRSKMKGLSIKYCIKRAACHRCCWDLLVKLVNHLKVCVDLRMVSCVVPLNWRRLVSLRLRTLEWGLLGWSMVSPPPPILSDWRGSMRWISRFLHCEMRMIWFILMWRVSVVCCLIFTFPCFLQTLWGCHLRRFVVQHFFFFALWAGFVALQGMARGKAKGILVWTVSLWSSISTSGVRCVLTWWKCWIFALTGAIRWRVSVVGSSLSFKKGDHLEPCNRVLKCDVIKN